MLARPGSPQGSGWMREISERLASGPADPSGFRSVPRGYWLIYLALIVMMIVAVPMMSRRIVQPQPPIHESATRIAGFPVFASGSSPVAFVAIGARPRGVIAVGGVAMGLIAIGGSAVGVFALGGISLGLIALGGGAIGWWALGAGVLGYYAFGGLAAGGYAYAGNGVAYGFYEASGRQRERLFG